MANWKEYRLGDVCTKIGSGSTPRGGGDTYLDEGEFALVRSQNILDFTFSYDGLAYISNDQADKLKNVSLEEKDILLNITGDSVARVCQVPSTIMPARVNQHVAIIRPDQKILNPEFLKYYLLNPSFKEHMLMLSSSGATRNAITKGMIEDFKILAPDIETQSEIAEILSSLDDKIELNNQINKNLEALAQALFKQWFIEFEFPNENGQPYKSSGGEMVESELGEIPKGWHFGNIEDIGVNIRKGISPNNFDPESAYVGLEHIPRKMLSISDWGIASDVDSQKSEFVKYDILFGKLRPYFHKVVVAPTNGICSTDILVIRPKKHEYFGYLTFHLFSNEIIEYATQVSGGTRMPRVGWNDLKQFVISIPDESLMSKFTSLSCEFIDQIIENTWENKSLALLRDALLPQLISGELEVSQTITESVM